MNYLTYFIVGPTAIGKSSLAIRLAAKIKGEIINADSMQVYNNLHILTARPSLKDHKIIKHHLYGYVEGSERYNVAKWCNDVVKIIKKNNQTSTPSIVVGGTGMYIDKLINGLINIPSIPESLKKKSESLFVEIGKDNFYNQIKEFDVEALKRISKNDTSRLRRIWEVYKHTDIPFSYWIKNNNNFFLNKTDYKLYYFRPPKDKIYNQVNKRFVTMIDQGAIDEVRKLNELKLDRSLPIMRAHGIPEISNYLSNLCSIEECIKKGQQVTRNYVKRQLTWWRSSTLHIHQTFDRFPNEIDENMINF